MPRVTPIWTNFTAGELSPRLEGRVDLQKYYNGVHSLENFLVHPHGGASRRPGTRFVAEVKDSSKKVRLVPFIFNVDQAYILEFGHQYVRFYYDQGQLLDIGAEMVANGGFSTATAWTLGTGWSIASGQADCDGSQSTPTDLAQSLSLTAGSQYQISYTLAGISAGSVRTVLGGSLGQAVSAAGEVTEYITAATSAGGLKIRGDADFTGSIDDVSLKPAPPYELAGPYTEAQLPALKYAQSADVMYLAHPNVATHKLSRLGHTSWTLATVSFTGATSAWTGATQPGSVGFFEQRLWLAGTPSHPQTLWASMAGNYEDFTTGVTADLGLVYTIASDRINRIRWLVPHQRLVVGTVGSEWIAGAQGSPDPMTPTNVKFDRETTYGSDDIQGRLINHAVLMVGKHGQRLREFAYSLNADGYTARDLTLLAEHITREGLVEFDFAQDPDNTLWLVRSDGVLLSCAYYPPEEVLAWARHTTQGWFESVAVIPGDGRDEVWAAVRREINGATRRLVEVFESAEVGQIEDAFFLDCGLSYSGAAASTICGLDHLEGEEVQVLADGAAHPDCTVQNGCITLERDAEKVQAGLGYTSLLETNRIEAGAQDGTSQARLKRTHVVAVRFYQTVGARVGVSESNTERIPFRTSSDPMDQAVPLFSGDKIIQVPGGWERAGRVVVIQDQPLPLTVLAIIQQLVSSEL